MLFLILYLCEREKGGEQTDIGWDRWRKDEDIFNKSFKSLIS